MVSDKAVTHVIMDLSASAPFSISSKSNPDRVEIDFPTGRWAGVAPSGGGDGLVSVYRRVTTGSGAGIVFETSGPVRVQSVGMGLAPPGRPAQFLLDLASADGSAIPAARHPTENAAAAGVVPTGAIEAALGLSGDTPQPGETSPGVAAKSVAPLQPSFLRLPAGTGTSATPVLKPIPVALSSGIAAIPRPLATSVPRHQPGARHIVAIDPGHGGIDPGTASADNVFEKTLTLQSGLALKEALEATGRYIVVMTRSDDTFVKLQDRVAIARAANAELFISLHCDAMEGREAHGATIYTLSQTASDAVTERLAASENRTASIGGLKLASEDAGTAGLLVDLSMSDSLNQSSRFAGLVVKDFEKNRIGLQELAPHRSAGFAVLKAADMPSVLIEMGYLSDAGDARRLADSLHQHAMAGALTEAINAYFERI